MSQRVSSELLEALRDSAPVMLGYVPLGMAFGLFFQSLGYHWLFAPLAGLIIYAGSAQFMAVGLLASGVPYAEAFIATLLLNSRHIFYGLSVLDRYPKRGLSRWYLIFGLTDETYSLITAKAPRVDSGHTYYLYLTALNQSYWITGCAIGAGLQSFFEFDPRGFEFALVALFVVLLIEQAKIMNDRWLLILALCAVFVAHFLVPEQFLLVAISLCLVALLVRPKRDLLNG